MTRSRLRMVGALGAFILTTGVSAQKDGGSPPPITDWLGTIKSPLFSLPPTPTATTKDWANKVFVAVGNPALLASIAGVDMSLKLKGGFGQMDLQVISSSDGLMTFVQTTEYAGMPKRTLTITLGFDGNTTADDGSGAQKLPLPPDALAAIRRAGDMWSPMLTALGQFETISVAGVKTYGGKLCTVLSLGKPRLAGLDSGTLYLDPVTNLPVGQETNVARDIMISGSTVITSWQTVNGIQVPKKMTVTGPDGTTELEISSIKFLGSDGKTL